ncbi:hypothetical protein ACA910_001439 [Epithemia clementina (nom. ined.)]
MVPTCPRRQDQRPKPRQLLAFLQQVIVPLFILLQVLEHELMVVDCFSVLRPRTQHHPTLLAIQQKSLLPSKQQQERSRKEAYASGWTRQGTSLLAKTDGGDATVSRRHMKNVDAQRRWFLISTTTAASSLFLSPNEATAVANPNSNNNLPLITTQEFGILLRESAQAIQVVEFSGPKSETVIVQLVDGTAFGLSDVVESPVDPRSPLKVAAMCRENRVPAKFVFLEAALKSAPKKNVLYTNERVLEAAEKEKEKQARMQQDETERLAQLYRMQQQQQQ